MMGGQTYFMQNHTKMRNVMDCPISVAVDVHLLTLTKGAPAGASNCALLQWPRQQAIT